jgi:multicomponent Na+:H+ antiporter subunit D
MSVLSPLPVAIPFLGAALLMALPRRVPRRVLDTLALTLAAATAGVCAALLADSRGATVVYWFGGWQPRDGIALGISFVIDPLGAGLALLAAVLVVAILVFCWRYFDQVGPLFPTLVLVFLGAMCGFCLTGDIFNLFVFFELMSVAAYALTGHKIEEPQALMGAFNFAVTNSVGAFLVLVGIALLYARTGALNLAQMGEALAGHSADGLVIAALALIACGFGVKAAFVPFHFWLDDAHAVAPSPICVLFSGVMVELGLYAIARVYATVFAGVEATAAGFRAVFFAVGVTTALVGAVMCLGERHLKRLLAFSTISHLGLFLCGVALLTPWGLAGTSLYVLGHGCLKGALFLGAGVLLNRFESVDENVLRGRGRIFPVLGLVFLLGGLGLSGLPPFGTYLGKALLDDAARAAGYPWAPAVFLLAAALTGGAILRASGAIFLGLGRAQNREADTPEREEKETKQSYKDVPLVMFAPIILLILLALIPGVWPGLDRQVINAAERFLDRPAYAVAVLEGETEIRSPAVQLPASYLAGVGYGLGAAAAAVAIALLALYSDRLPGALRKPVERGIRPGMQVLRWLHSGHVGDYVTWLILGVAIIGGCWALLMR